MFAQYFGQFLLNQGLVSAQQLDQAITAQQNTRVKLGVLAINQGYMSPEQVEIVHEAQSRMDKRFGEIAVEFRYVSEEQVTEMLAAQQPAHLVLGQALIDQGIMNYEGFTQALKQYKTENSLSDDQFESIVNGSIETLLEAVLSKEGLSEQTQMLNYTTLLAKNLIRFIDSQILVEVSSPEKLSNDWVTIQSLNNSQGVNRFTAIGGTEASFLKLASLYAEETIDSPGEMMEASVGEFLNLHNGIYLVNLSNEGTELQMAPQSVVKGSEFDPNDPIHTVINIKGTGFEINLILSDLSALV
jgi:hypothetical protein